MAKAKEFTEAEMELWEYIYQYAIDNRMSIGSVEAVTRSAVKELKGIAYVTN